MSQLTGRFAVTFWLPTHLWARVCQVSETPLLSQLLAMLGPDIRSSLGELQGTLHLIAHDLAGHQDEDVGARRRQELITNAQERVHQFTSMLSIVTHLDALSRGGPKMRPEQIDLRRVLDRLAHQLNAQSTGENVGLEVHLDPGSRLALTQVCLDATNLVQLLGYVLRFAWFTTQENRVSVEVHCDGSQLQVSIANHGTVMSSAELSQLFSLTPWANQLSHRVQGDDPTVRLGLNLAMTIARAINGQCEVRSDPLLGSVWDISIPTLPASALSAELASDGSFEAKLVSGLEPKAKRDFSDRPQSLLLVDDSHSSRLVTRALLEDLGHNVAEAANGIEALVRLRTDPLGPFDAVILDLMMPEMDGLSAAKAVRELPAPQAQSVKLIALTGHNSPAEIQAAKQAGFDDFLSKPVDRTALEQCLDRLLGEREDPESKAMVNAQALSELEAMLGEAAMDRLLKQFLVELDERMQTVMSFGDGDVDDVYHNIHMMRYSAEHFGFERLAECAKRLSQIRLSLEDVSFARVTSEHPQVVFEPSAAAQTALQQLSVQIEAAREYLEALFASRCR